MISTVMASFCVMMAVSGAVDAALEPSDERIDYAGRWDNTDTNHPWCAWQGSSFRLSFNGTGVRAEITCGETVEYVRVVVDGNGGTSKKIELQPGKHRYTLVSGLRKEGHQLELIKETYTGRGRMTLDGLVVVEGDATGLPASETSLRIEFYGDSNLAAVSLENEKNKGDPKLRGSFYSFAGIASRMLDAEYHNISSGGAKLATGLNSGLSFFDRIDFFESDPKWQFDKFAAEICVINLGANDIFSKEKSEIKQDFKRLITALREVRPDAHIVLMNAYGWARSEPANYTQEVVTELGDDNLSVLKFPWLFNEWHGCEYDHAGMAKTLVNHLTRVNGKWKQRRPMDVMDGFGRNGDVANGSFEESSPFGGYGWRYFTDGAERVHDPRESADGEWFLRLKRGTQVHQPNPAKLGGTYRVRLKMRGETRLEQVKLRFEFRDQEWRNEIPHSAEQWVVDLRDEWTEYSFHVRAPSEPSSQGPSYDPWQMILRIEAVAGRVDLDDVRLESVPCSERPLPTPWSCSHAGILGRGVVK